jgi:hypothetical protein
MISIGISSLEVVNLLTFTVRVEDISVRDCLPFPLKKKAVPRPTVNVRRGNQWLAFEEVGRSGA